MKPPTHLWSGDWRTESEKARDAAAEDSARRRAAAQAAAAAAAAAASVTTPPRPRARRTFAALAVVLAAAVVTGAVFLAGALVGGNDAGSGPAALPAVSSAPLKPHAGQTRAGAVYAAASPAVVSVKTSQGSGTGFLIDRDGTLVTNAHVVGSSGHVIVRFGSDGRSLDASVLGTDPSSDVAVLSIDSPDVPSGVKPLQFADSRAVRIGDTAIAIGNPFGLDRTATEGIVSGVGREIQAPNGFQIDAVIQTDAPINPGNSGGPLLDDSAHVIGINSQIATAGSQGNVGIGFAVPSNTVRQVVPRLQRGETIKRPYLGLQTTVASVSNPTAVTVARVVAGSPAERAGIQPGDSIVRVAGQAVNDPSDVSTAIDGKKPGDHVKIEVARHGSTRTVDVTLGTRPASTP